MAVKISGVLKDGTGKPVQNCTIQLKAKRNSTTVVVNTLASENPDEAGRYSMDVEYGQYSVILLVEGFPPSHAGTITVYEDSQPGTLNDFLGAMTEDDARPEALRRFELMVEEVARNASVVAQNTAAAKKSASDASTSAREAATHATDAAGSARAASTSAGQAATSAQSASSSAGTASTKATEASKSAAAAESSKSAAATSAGAAKTSETNAAASQKSAATSASTATTKASEAATSARDAAASKEAAKSSETNASSSASSAASSATAAGNSAKAAKTSETNADNSAQAAAASQTASANSATAAKKSETNAKNSEAAAKSSETNAKASETNAKSSETNAAKSAADALNYRNQAQVIVGDNIGLGSAPRDCPDISGNPSGYIGFMRIMASAKGFPSIASGESSLTGFISQVDGSPAYTGIFQGWASRSLYTYRWSTDTGPQWTRHARKDEVNRLSQWGSETWLYNSDSSMRLGLTDSSWGCYSDTQKKWIPLDVSHGGTGATNAETARANLGVGSSNSPQFVNVALKRTTDVTTGWVAGGIFHSTLAGTSGTERVYGAVYPETNLTKPDQLTMHLRTGGVSKYASLTANGEFIADYFKANKGYAINAGQDWNAQHTDAVEKFKPIAGSTNGPLGIGVVGGFHVTFSGNYATQFAGRNSSFYARSFEAGVDKGWRQLATLNEPVQRWTGYQQFKSTEFFTDTYSRKLSLTISTSAVRNGNIELWGASNRPTVFEYKIRDPETNASLKYAFYAQQNTDDSIEFNVNGTVTCISINQSSDRDLKDNIQVIGDATEAIRKMNGYTYTLKENGLPYAGVIAQEVMEALPEAVGSFTHYGEALQGPTVDGNELREETRYLNVDYAAVTGLLVQVARETDDRVTALEEENTTLRENLATAGTRITTLENQVSELVALVRQLTGSEH
ncbi:prophage tail fiber N-terminal domain and S74 family endopeptidase-containing protein [Escherichia coli]|uniref:prophage tail fiber N-terminal domain and S74 family endopeptidase-containing protein n=1 Tax=Escherichia coli TaxID=562 RepID=UPI00352393B7